MEFCGFEGMGCEALSLFLRKAKNSSSNKNNSTGIHIGLANLQNERIAWGIPTNM